MKQKAENLLTGTIVKNKVGELGRLVHLQHDRSGKLCWIIDWAGRGLEILSVDIVNTYELA